MSYIDHHPGHTPDNLETQEEELRDANSKPDKTERPEGQSRGPPGSGETRHPGVVPHILIVKKKTWQLAELNE